MKILAFLGLLLSVPAPGQNCLQQELDPSPVAAGQLGSSVSVDEPFAVAGAPEAGHVQVYLRTGGVWTPVQSIETPSGFVGGEFGYSVDVQGSTLVVGDKPADRAYVYEWNGASGQFDFLQVLQPIDLVTGDAFGQDVSVEGTSVLVASMKDDDNGNNSGSVYRFELIGSTYVEQQKILAPDGSAGDYFGVAIDTDYARLVVGAIYDDPLGQDSGSAYVFERAGAAYVYEQKLVPLDGVDRDYFGVSVATDNNNRIVIGAEGVDDLGSFAGAAYVFHLGSSWNQAAKLLAWDGAAGDDFGFSVTSSGEWYHIGARAHNNGYGAVYRFCVTSNGTVIPSNKFEPIEPTPAETFGASVDMDTGSITSGIIGAQGHGVGPIPAAGAVYFVQNNGPAMVDCNGNFIDDFCELSAGAATDVNGNGTLDECETVGTVLCSPNSPNSTGDWGKMLAFGTDAVASNDLTLWAYDLPANRFGIFITGMQPGFIAFPGGSQGLLCLTGTIGRFSQNILISDFTGTYSLQIDLAALPLTPPVAAQAGETWYFQSWHRDLNPDPTSNFTEAVEVTFQ